MICPLVSILLPAYNAEVTLKECLDSLLSQTYKNFEIILIDDGSKDSTLDIAMSYDDARIRIFSNDSNKGLIYTLNRGLTICLGKYIVRMDADDIAYPNRIEVQVNYMEGNLDVMASGCQMDYFGEGIPYAFKTPLSYESSKAVLLINSPIFHPTAIIRRCVFEQYKIKYEYGYMHAEDYKLWSDISRLPNAKITNINDVLLHYRMSPTQVSNKFSNIQQKTTKIIRRENINALISKNGLEIPERITPSFICKLTKTFDCYSYGYDVIPFMLYMSIINPFVRVAVFIFSRDCIKLSRVCIKHTIIIILSCIFQYRWKGYSL